MQDEYIKKVALLLRCLPAVAQLKCFALKGGTAINLFINPEFPRLSVDIDLTYLPIEDRAATILGIEKGLLQISELIQRKNPGSIIKPHISNATKSIIRLLVSNQDTAIKIEPNLILRGNLLPVVNMDLVAKAVDEFKTLVINVPVMAKAEVYAGKMCAALDRQHPRDLFDIFYLLQQGGLNEELKNVFLVYLISANRPMHEILQPNRLDQQKAYQDEFFGMANLPIAYEVLLETRERLIQNVIAMLNENDKKLLLSIKQGDPDWSNFAFVEAAELPSVKWKLLNINKMPAAKKQEQLKKLMQVLSG